LAKFHINPITGNSGRCLALKKCRFGGDEEHYPSKESASFAYEAARYAETLTVLRKSAVELKTLVEDFAIDLHEPKGPLLEDSQIAEIDQKFENLRRRSSTAMSEFNTPLELNNGSITTTIRHEQGRALVAVNGSQETNFDGDYPVGDLTQDSETIANLIKTDPDLQFINGECATLAWDLYDAYPEKVKCVSEIWVKDDVGSMHVIAEMKDGTFIDGLGHWTPSGVLSAWKGLMGKDVEIRLGEVDENHKRRDPMLESTRILGRYLDRLQ
jgi:hypothetical protein